MRYILLLLLVVISSYQSYAQQRPSFKEVVTEFFTQYAFDSNETFPRFQKKKDGWYIVEESYTNSDEFTNLKLFWSLEKKQFLKLNYSISEKDSIQVANRIVDYLNQVDGDYLEYAFQRNKYYGYAGWDWDIISEKQKDISSNDTVWESLGRAYSNYASGFLFDQAGDLFQNNDSDRVILEDKNKISQSRITKFILHEIEAINSYKKIIDVNPGYQTRVGNIKLKYANEYLYSYGNLMMAGDSVSAKLFLEGFAYPDSILELSKSYLKAIPLNAILITGGDNDTYSLWYLQEAKNMRKDVIVINISLLGLRRYVSMLDKRFKGTLFTTKDSVYYQKNFDYFLYYEPKKPVAAISASKFIYDVINQSYGEQIFQDGRMVKSYVSKQVYFNTTGSGKNLAYHSVTNKIIQLKDHLLMNEFMLLDIINSNINKRSVYFTYKEPFLETALVLKDNIYKLQLTRNLSK